MSVFTIFFFFYPYMLLHSTWQSAEHSYYFHTPNDCVRERTVCAGLTNVSANICTALQKYKVQLQREKEREKESGKKERERESVLYK